MSTLASLVTRTRVAATSAIFATFASTAAMAFQSDQARTAERWREAAQQDIEQAIRLMRANHPGAYDAANPGFLKKLDQAGQRALDLTEKIDGPAGYVAAIEAFDASLGDGHALIVPQVDFDTEVKLRWPGFVTVWRESGLYVYASEANGPAPGMQVVECDGKPIKQLIEDNVFAFAGRSDQPGLWWSRARSVFIDAGNPFIDLPQQCWFSRDGRTFQQTLTWRPETPQAKRWLKESYNGQTLPVGLSEPRKGLLWVAMPTFDPDAAQREAYRALSRQVESERQRFLDADAVVIDLRQNQGGSSTWSRDFAGALWGADRVKRRDDARSARTETWWRASKGNTAYLASLVQKFIDEKRPEDAQWAKRNSAGMRAALARGEKYYVEKDEAPAAVTSHAAAHPDQDLPTDPPPFTKPVYVIVPGQCASACLDALDTFTLFSNTILIGAPSAADSTYMEVRSQKLGSGLASVVIPNKMYVNRARANGQAYLPAVYVNDLDWSVETFRKVVEGDLARRRGELALKASDSPPAAGAGSAARSAPTPR